MRRRSQLTTLFITLLLLEGCAGGPPSEGKATEALQKFIHDRSEGRIRLVDLHKTDDQSREVNGVGIYEMDIEGQIEILQDCYWKQSTAISSYAQFATVVGDPKGALERFKYNNVDKLTRASKGDRFQITGSLTFEQKESGWNLYEWDVDVLN